MFSWRIFVLILLTDPAGKTQNALVFEKTVATPLQARNDQTTNCIQKHCDSIFSNKEQTHLL